jgi:hypothetical protein
MTVKIRVGGNRAYSVPYGYATIDDQDEELVSKYTWTPLVGNVTTYAYTKINGKTVLMHRLITGAPNGTEVDHRDRDGLNNVRSNIRVATVSQHRGYSRKRNDGITSKYKGVCLDNRTGHYKAAIQEIHIGTFHTEREAAIAYNERAIAAFGEFAELNDVCA